MKRALTLSLVFLATLFQLFSVSAQNDIVTTITPKVRMFPATGFSYLDDPGRFFNIQMINTNPQEEKQIYFTISLSCDFSATNESFFVYTKPEFQPNTPLTIGSTPLVLHRNHFDQIIGNLNSAAYVTNVDRNELTSTMFTLPEGQYRFCIKPYIWTGHNDLNPISAGEEVCYTFTVCYSGSAPEFTSPVNGYSANNLNNSNPANNLLGGVVPPSSDNRNSSQYTVLPLSRNVTFTWTGVISNCLTVSDFNYTLKIVEVYKNQNIHEAINNNATIATIENRNRTSYLHDTTANRHFRLERGHVYAAQVIAVLRNSLLTDVALGNEGRSQVIAFVWGESEVIQDQQGSITSSTSDNRDQVKRDIRDPYLVTPGKDNSTYNTLITRVPSEASAAPSDDHYSTYVGGNEPYYQVTPSDTLRIKWMPVRGDSVLRVKYAVSLYEYVGGEIANSLNVQPICKKDIECNRPDASFNVDPVQVMDFPQLWKDTLQKGYKYVLHLDAETFYSYNQRTTYTITEYIHNMPSPRDSIADQVMYGTDNYSSNVVFAWGIDSGALDKVNPPQFTYPVDLTHKALDDTTWVEAEFPEVVKRESFSFRWNKATGVDYGDSVYYKLKVGKLPKGKKPNEVKSFFYIKDSIVATEYIDSVLFDTLKTKEQYVAVLEMKIKQMEDTSQHYNIINNGRSHYATFKLKDPPEFVADLNDKIKCFPKALDKLSKEFITPAPDSLITNKVQLKIGEFPLVVQTAVFDSTKKVYNGDGYVIWHPLGIDVRLKVKIDSIQINKDFQVIKGTAVSTVTDSSTYLDALTNDLDMDQWTNDDINAVVSKLGENETIKGYYDKFQEYGEKYAKKYGGLLGPLMGENMATPVMTFPLSITDEEITGSKNVIFAINNMYFSPVTALMNLWAIFAAQSDNAYIPFLANNICMDQQGFLGNSSKHIELFMGRDYEIELNDGYKMRFKKSSNFADPKDGTVIVVDTGKLSFMMAELQFDMNPNDVMGIEKDGTPRKGKVVQASLLAKIKDWDDWVAKITMDPFAIAGCDRFTFVPTGRGIFYDHSSTESPKEVAIDGEYLLGNDAKPKQNETDEQKKERQKKIAKATKEWQGFYWDELTVFLSDEISNTFSDQEGPKDSVVTYTHGINGTVTDSAHYCYPGSRINFGAKGLIIDKNGFTAELFARDIIRADTKSGGGWAFSLDTISVKFVKNQYKAGVIKGGFGIPLFSGGFAYDCSIGSDSLEFSIKAVEDTLKLDMWLASVDFDPKSSYFRIKKIYKESNTRIDLTLNGKINVAFNKIGIPINCALAKFEHMGMRNWNSGKAGDGTAVLDKFEFDIGNWSFASPQKSLGGAPSDGNGEQVDENGEPLASVSFAGFTFSITKLAPIITFEKSDLKLGIDVTGQMKFDCEAVDLGVTTGFAFWGIIDPMNHFHVKKVDAKLKSIKFDQLDFQVFKLDGLLDFFSSTGSGSSGSGSGSSGNSGGGGGGGNSNNNGGGNSGRSGGSGGGSGSGSGSSSGVNSLSGLSVSGGAMGDGFGGSLTVTIMSKVTLSMSAGFGTKKDSKGTFTWWYFDGACKFPGGIALGVVSINGFSGGFAYNMKASKSLTDPSYSAVNLLKTAEKNTNAEATAASGMEFTPERDSWVANAGISLVLTGAENTMNADGLISLRISNKHFSGIFIDANAYVMSKMDKSKTPGDGSNNNSPLIRAKAIMGFERTSVYDYFRLSIAVKADINLSKLLEGASSTLLGSSLSGIHGGLSMVTSSNVTKELNKLTGTSGIGSHDAGQRENAADASTSGSSGKPSFSLTASVPIDFELKHYKKKDGNHKAGSTDWYFAIGKPKYEERVQLKSKLNLIVCTAEAEFTFYMQTGNAFAYQMPPLSKDLKKFFGLEDDDKKLDTDSEGVKNARKLKNTDWLAIDNGGGFCMGSTFHAYLALDFFLYVHVTADLGFDVALLDVSGVGCPGHSQIGKNNFYALGRVYAALQGDVGLKINLGFWKGEFSLFKAGIGALLQGGGPNPSYAYGMLRFKIDLLNGLLKFSTSVDFKVGDVCVPGAGDPLANVKLFQSVTPGFETEAAAKTNSNLQSPLQVGSIVSNMPWDKEVYLADEEGKNARKFYFTLIEKNVKYQTRQSASGSYYNTSGNQVLTFTASRDDANVLFFETKDGGLVPDRYSKLVLQARGFEWRTKVPDKELSYISNGQNKDYPYYVTGTNKGTMKSSNSGYGWFDPTFYNDNSKKKIVKKYQKDSTFYFKTKDLGNKLEDQVVYSWPYNGDKVFPLKEYAHSTSSVKYGNGRTDVTTPYAMLYLYTRRDDIFDKTTLSNNGKQLKIFLLTQGGEMGTPAECSYSYFPNATVPYVKVILPKSEWGKSGVGPHKLQFLIVNSNAYQSAQKAAAAALTEKKKEFQSRIASSTYQQAQSAHNSNASGGKKKINLKNQQLDEIYQNKKGYGVDSMVYYRIKAKENYKIAASIGDCVYEWTWFADGNYDTYGDYIARNISNSDLANDLRNCSVILGGSCITLKFKSSKQYWPFLPYDPQDKARYKTTMTLPPRAYLALNGGDKNLAYMHKTYFQHFLDMERDFKQTPLKEYRYTDDKGDVDFSTSPKVTVSNNTLKNELKNILAKGFIANYSCSFPHIDRRIKGGTSFTQCAANGYHPTTVDVPCLIDFTSNQELEPMDEKYFGQSYSGKFSIGQGNGTYSITIYDYATPAIVNDIKMFHDFMQFNQQHAKRFDQRGWSHKVDYFKDYYSSKYKNAKFSHPNFPFDIPEIYIVTHYMTVLDNVWLAGRSSYYTPQGDYLHFYSRDEDFAYYSDLQLKDRLLTKYWWSAAGQCLDISVNGFDRDFYYWKNSTRYYYVRSNQADKGKHKIYTTKSNVLGFWYTNTMYNDIGNTLKNSMVIYYLTSQSDNFETCLMNNARAVKLSNNQTSKIFYPNAKITPNNCYYNVNIKGSALDVKLKSSGTLEVKDSGNADFGR